MANKADNAANYAHFLTQIFNWMFPTLLYKALKFYLWYNWEKQKPPEQLYTSSDLKEMAASLKKPPEKDSQIDYLAEWIQHQPVADACGVMGAILRRIDMVQQKPRTSPKDSIDAVDAVKDCLMELAGEVKKNERKKP